MKFTDSHRKAFKEAKSGEFPTLPDGFYKAILEKVDARPFGQNRETKLMMIFKVFDPPEFNGIPYSQFISLENKAAYGYLKFVLARFGHNPEEMTIDDVFPSMEDCTGYEVHFSLAPDEKNDKYQKFNLKMVSKNGEAKEEAKPIEAGDDIPF